MADITKHDRARAVIDAVLESVSLKDALTAHDMTVGAFHHQLSQDRQLAVSYARAQEIRADQLADQALEIADTDEDSARARNRITVRQWLASKLHSKRYGDRIDLTVTQTLDIGSTLAEARARLLPGCYPGQVIDGEILDKSNTYDAGASDSISQAPAQHAQEPDIFS